MKKSFTAGLLKVIAVVLLVLVIQAGESLSLEVVHPAGGKKSILDKKTEIPPGEKAAELEGGGHSLEVLLEEVLSSNPELKFYEAEIHAAKGRRMTAGLWSNPEVSGSAGHKSVESRSDAGESKTSTGAAGEISLTQSLEWPGRIRLRKAIADHDIELAELGLEQFRGLLKARVKITAYVLSAAQEKAAATREVADQFRALREVLVQRGQAGLTPLLESRVIEAIELNMQRKASQAALAAKAALLDLNQLRGAESEAVPALRTVNFEFNPLGKNKSEFIALARANDFQVRMRAIELARQGDKLRLSKNERFPSIAAGPAIVMERAGERERILGAVISLPLPLWDRNQGSIAAAKALQIQAEVSLDVARRDAERRVVAAITIYETKLNEMEKWQPESIQHFKEAAELADRHYRLGAVPVSTYIELQSQYLETIEGLQETKKEALETAAQLELMTGTDLSLTQTSPGNSK